MVPDYIFLFQCFQFLGKSAHIRFHTGDIMVVPDKVDSAVRIFEQASVDVREDGFIFITFDILVRSFRLSGLAPQNERTSPTCRLIHAGNDKPVLRAFDIMHFRSPHCMKAVVHRITVDGFLLIFLSRFIYFRLLLPGSVFSIDHICPLASQDFISLERHRYKPSFQSQQCLCPGK